MRQAMYYSKQNKKLILCELCPHYCLIEEGKSGKCKVRTNINNTLYASSYGQVTAYSEDPIEKKPLYHFYPGESIFSVGFYGCNMTCGFCQNHDLSQKVYDRKTIDPEELIKHVKGFGIAFTYNEPFINYEYLYDFCKLLKKEKPDKKIVLVSNGFINPEPLKKILPYIDAFNIDLKGNDSFYNLCGGSYQLVLNNIREMAKKHLEVTTLLVTHSVSLEDVEMIAMALNSIDKKMPYHLSRYFPSYQFVALKTPIEFMLKAGEIANKYMDYVYLGNIHIANDTRCKKCNCVLVKRDPHRKVLSKGKCTCGYDNNIIGV